MNRFSNIVLLTYLSSSTFGVVWHPNIRIMNILTQMIEIWVDSHLVSDVKLQHRKSKMSTSFNKG